MRFSANIILKKDEGMEGLSYQHGETLKLDDAKQEVVMKNGDDEERIDYEDILSFNCNLISDKLFKDQAMRKMEALDDEPEE
jgi:hypothetical protein